METNEDPIQSRDRKGAVRKGRFNARPRGERHGLALLIDYVLKSMPDILVLDGILFILRSRRS